MKLVFASANEKKRVEIEKILPDFLELITLNELDFHEDIPETADSFEGNARLKAACIHERFKVNCFADDSGLEIEALAGEPGVFSARYAGEQGNHEKNMDLVLQKLRGNPNRNAQFKTVLCLIWENEIHYFEGRVQGTIRTERSGSGGFGYDPIFEPEQQGKTFAEMTLDEKNSFSHRARALEKMIAFLNDKKS